MTSDTAAGGEGKKRSEVAEVATLLDKLAGGELIAFGLAEALPVVKVSSR